MRFLSQFYVPVRNHCHFQRKFMSRYNPLRENGGEDEIRMPNFKYLISLPNIFHHVQTGTVYVPVLCTTAGWKSNSLVRTLHSDAIAAQFIASKNTFERQEAS